MRICWREDRHLAGGKCAFCIDDGGDRDDDGCRSDGGGGRTSRL